MVVCADGVSGSHGCGGIYPGHDLSAGVVIASNVDCSARGGDLGYGRVEGLTDLTEGDENTSPYEAVTTDSNAVTAVYTAGQYHGMVRVCPRRVDGHVQGKVYSLSKIYNTRLDRWAAIARPSWYRDSTRMSVE